MIPALVRLARRVAALQPLRSVLKRPGVERFIATFLRATTVHESSRFVFRELLPTRSEGRYRLRESNLAVLIRHGTPDVVTLDEVFYLRDYDLPERVQEALGRLARPPQVLDLGANIGLFGIFVTARFPGAQVTAFEPDRFNAAVLRRCIEENGFEGSWNLVEAAAAPTDGTVPFIAGHFSLSKIDDASGNERVRSVDVFPYLARADLAKVDIEGGEWSILGDERLSSSAATFVVLEYHRHLCPDPDPKSLARERLQKAGYEVGESSAERTPGHGMLWGWKES